MSVVNSVFALKRARPLGTEVASYQSWEWRCKPLWLARIAPTHTEDSEEADAHGIPQERIS